MADRPDIGRLIEEGLKLYGQGDLDQALLVWEEALAVDPDNEQANSYVDYVRANYELLTSEAAAGDDAPFGIASDEPEYQIEILPGEVRPVSPAPPLYMDPLDEGWSLENEMPPVEGTLTVAKPRTISDQPTMSGVRTMFDPDTIAEPRTLSEEGTLAAPRVASTLAELGLELEPPLGPSLELPRTESIEVMLELEADEPPIRTPLVAQPTEVSFESPTREYDSTTRVVAEFQAEETPAFGVPSDRQTPPVEFDSVTSIQERHRGFVKPAAPPPELKLTFRTPSSYDDESIVPTAAPPADSAIALSYDEPEAVTLDRGSQGTPSSAELLSSLPSPRPASGSTPPPRAASASDTQDTMRAARSTLRPPATASRPPATTTTSPRGPSTRDYPAVARRPATAPPPIATNEKPTQDFSPQKSARLLSPGLDAATDAEERAFGEASRDVPTSKMPALEKPEPPRIMDSPLISAPTRDLGLRAAAVMTAASRPAEEAREDTATGVHVPLTRPVSTDPVDIMTDEILASVDDGASATEPDDERTRRRIMVLFERAAAWSRSDELSRAAIAIDLAMSEDPNSALAQKLIHRNRDTIMFVFQAYLGDMNRAPTLARPLHQLGGVPISPRAAFLLSRIDGLFTLEEILDVSGMPRLEACRYLCQLFLRGILRS